MNRGQARRESDETVWEDAPASYPSLCAQVPAPSVVPVSTTRRARASAETLRGVAGNADPFADTQAALPDSALGRRDWCVDRGDALLTMTTFELWAAIERSEVAPWMRVWREGMECWTPAGELIELSWAVANTPHPAAEAITGPLPPPPPLPRRLSSLTERTDTPAPASGTVSRVPRESTAVRAEARSQPRGARWVALGSLVAAASIAAAFVGTTGFDVAAPAAPVSAVAPPARVADQADLPGLPGSPELAPPPPAEPPPAEPARREERGQRRLPRGGGHAYGR